MKTKKKIIGALGVTAIAAGALVAASPASAADQFAYMAQMAGSQATILGQTVESDLTANSRIQGNTFPNSSSNSIASTKIANALTLGAVTTSESAKLVTGGAEITSTGETAGVNLLGGLVKIDAVQTTVVTDYVNGKATVNAHTTFVGLHVLGANIPVNVPENFEVNLGIADLKLNTVNTTVLPNGVLVFANALDLTLLKPKATSPAGSEIILNPSQVANVNKSVVTSPVLNGLAFATHVSVVVPHFASVESGMTAELVMPRTGTNGQTVTNHTAAVNLGALAKVGAIQTTENGLQTTGVSSVSMGYEVGKINLLNGLITADAIEGTATDTQTGPSTYVPTTETQFVNLKIAGKSLPITISPNTVINLAGLATVTINKEESVPQAAAVYGIIITLTVAKYGLPVGAQIQVGEAIAGINLTG
jgi:hypothetical protein